MTALCGPAAGGTLEAELADVGMREGSTSEGDVLEVRMV